MAAVAYATMPALPLIWDGTDYTATLPSNYPIQVWGNTTLFARPLNQTGVGNWVGGYVPPNSSTSPPPRFQLTDAMITDNWTIVRDNNGAPDPTQVIYSGPSIIPTPAFDVGLFYIARSIVGDPTIQYNISPNVNTPGNGIAWVTALTITITPPASTTTVSNSTATAGKARCLAQEQASALKLELLQQEKTQNAMDYNDLGLLVSVTCTRLGLSGRELLLTGLRHDIVAEGDPVSQTWDVTYTLESMPDFDALGSGLFAVFDEALFDSGRFAP